jgi:hypothetical protein
VPRRRIPVPRGNAAELLAHRVADGPDADSIATVDMGAYEY